MYSTRICRPLVLQRLLSIAFQVQLQLVLISVLTIINGKDLQLHFENHHARANIFVQPFPWPFSAQMGHRDDIVYAASSESKKIIPHLNKICGRRFIHSPRISGGSAASYGKWPWQISLKIRQPNLNSVYDHYCGAVLLNASWAATAAHCVNKLSVKYIQLGLGEFDFSDNENHLRYPSVKRRVKNAIMHPNFNPATFENDLALLQFNEPVSFQPNIVPICLPNPNIGSIGHLGQIVHVTGWGKVFTGQKRSKLPNLLQDVELPIVPNAECESKVKLTGYNWPMSNKTFICAGKPNNDGNGNAACWGDSGGPMVVENTIDKKWVLVGVTSFGVVGPCGQNAPSAFTRVSAGTLDFNAVTRE